MRGVAVGDVWSLAVAQLSILPHPAASCEFGPESAAGWHTPAPGTRAYRKRVAGLGGVASGAAARTGVGHGEKGK